MLQIHVNVPSVAASVLQWWGGGGCSCSHYTSNPPSFGDSDSGCKRTAQASFLAGEQHIGGAQKVCRAPTHDPWHGLHHALIQPAQHNDPLPVQMSSYLCKQMNLLLTRYQVTLSLLTPTTRHVTHGALRLEELYGAAVACATQGGPAAGRRNAGEPRLPAQGAGLGAQAAGSHLFPFPCLHSNSKCTPHR